MTVTAMTPAKSAFHPLGSGIKKVAMDTYFSQTFETENGFSIADDKGIIAVTDDSIE